MTRSEFFELLDKLENEQGLRFEVGEGFEGAQYILFEVEEDEEEDEEEGANHD